MPDIFSKNCNFKVIEYGASSQDTMLKDLKSFFTSLFHK